MLYDYVKGAKMTFVTPIAYFSTEVPTDKRGNILTKLQPRRYTLM